MDKYECTKCGYIYDPQVGAPQENVPPGTPFEKLPASFACPKCKTFLSYTEGCMCSARTCKTFKKIV